MALTDSEDFDLDLDAERTARREVRKTPALKFDGQRFELPPELPVDVLAPLKDVNMDVALLVRQVLDARNADPGQANEAMLDAVVNMMIANDQLPQELIEAITTGAKRLLGEDGYAALVAWRPSIGDLGAIAKYLGRSYGVGLGEASESSESSEDTGTTSKPTSSGSTKSTSAASGGRRARKAS